jgi:hypothetical protein
MSVSDGGGRFGNQVIRNLACSIVSEKFDLHTSYKDKDIVERLGIKLYSGNKIYNETILLKDDNYFDILNLNELKKNFYGNDYLQTKDISNLIYRHIHTNLKYNIINSNKFKERYNNNNDCFIHIRLGDVIWYNPGLEYYLKALGQLNFNNLYIASDSLDHDIIKVIVEKYPNTQLINYDEVETIQFGSTNKYIVLSHGTFSATTGYLSFFSDIYYPQYNINKLWYGDIFTIEGWNEIKLYD